MRVVEGVFTVPGDGSVDFGAVFAALPGYCGWVVLEAEQDPRSPIPLVYATLGLRDAEARCVAQGCGELVAARQARSARARPARCTGITPAERRLALSSASRCSICKAGADDSRARRRTASSAWCCSAGAPTCGSTARIFGIIGARTIPFDGKPFALYVPPRADGAIAAQTPRASWRCARPRRRRRCRARLIRPDDVGEEMRGTRHQHPLRPQHPAGASAAAEHLLVVEVVTPGGHWSSYPPHKHDTRARRGDASSRRPTTTACRARAASPFSASTPRTARWMRRWRSRTATWCWCRAAITR